MTSSFNVIGDIAGNYKTLMALLEKMPEGTPVSVGDMVDRGPRSRQVLEFFQENGLAVYGNHEDLMIDFYTYYDCNYPAAMYGDTFKKAEGARYIPTAWYANGGKATDTSFPTGRVTQELLNYVKNLPLYLELECDDKKFLVTHAPIRKGETLKACLELDRPTKLSDFYESATVTWNRSPNIENLPEYDLQISGHNSHWGLKWTEDFAVCLDTSRDKILTGIHLPTKTIYQQEFID